MNTLVLPLILYEISGYFRDKSIGDIETTMERMQKVSEFDGFLIIESEAKISRKRFSFTKVRRKILKASKSLEETIRKVLGAIDGLYGESEQIVFTILCANDAAMDQIAQEMSQRNRACFISLDVRHEPHNFTKILPPKDDDMPKFDYPYLM
jgi:methyl-accepting chemotaxis protein